MNPKQYEQTLQKIAPRIQKWYEKRKATGPSEQLCCLTLFSDRRFTKNNCGYWALTKIPPPHPPTKNQLEPLPVLKFFNLPSKPSLQVQVINWKHKKRKYQVITKAYWTLVQHEKHKWNQKRINLNLILTLRFNDWVIQFKNVIQLYKKVTKPLQLYKMIMQYIKTHAYITTDYGETILAKIRKLEKTMIMQCLFNKVKQS